ncbi:MAG TPA: glycosyltransferase family 4 protein [Terriglobales bacterium]|jgi:glycosyltransferase involved in cell wall biosynthesis
MLRVVAYTGGDSAPSGRYRVEQYVPYLKDANIEVTVRPSRAGSFPPVGSTWKRSRWAIRNLIEHLPCATESRQYDLTFFQREMFSNAVSFEPFTKRPRVFDVDDAAWAGRRGGFARRLARYCDHVICGNRFVAEQFSRWNRNVSVLPTPVDTQRWVPAEAHPDRPVIGWLGLSYGFRYLQRIEPALREILLRHRAARLRIISSRIPEFRTLPPDQVEFVPFASQPEPVHFQQVTIGIMPLDDSVVSRGKCSFKMLQYMACGLPVVVTPCGMNGEILQEAGVGFGAQTLDQWVDSLDKLLTDPDLSARMGQAGRALVEKSYSVEALAPRLAAVLRNVAGQ